MTGAAEMPVTRLRLHPAYPNPFHPETRISFELGSPGIVEVAVHDVAGRRVATLLHGHRSAGDHTLTWNGHDDGGQRISSGVYFVRLKSLDGVHVRKLTLLK